MKTRRWVWAFPEMVCKSVEEYFQTDFDLEVAIPIGYPSKNHKFDCVSDDKKIEVECKCCIWTDTGNVPSAKMMGMNEALLYMSYLPEDTTKILCIKKAIKVKNVPDSILGRPAVHTFSCNMRLMLIRKRYIMS